MKGTRKDRINMDEPKPKKGSPVMPDWLCDEAKEEWFKLIPILEDMKVLTEADGVMLATLCQNYVRAKQCERVLDEKGLTFTTPNGYVQQRPETSLAHKYWAIVIRCAAHFGLSPAERSRLHVEKKEDVNPYEAFRRKH